VVHCRCSIIPKKVLAPAVRYIIGYLPGCSNSGGEAPESSGVESCSNNRTTTGDNRRKQVSHYSANMEEGHHVQVDICLLKVPRLDYG
jgi:hypothetical protein